MSEHSFYDIQFAGTELRFKSDSVVRYPDRDEVRATYKVIAALSANGNTLRLAYTPMPLLAWQEAYAKNFAIGPRHT